MTIQFVPGLLFRQVFILLQKDIRLGSGLTILFAWMIGVALGRLMVVVGAVWVEQTCIHTGSAALRQKMIQKIFECPDQTAFRFPIGDLVNRLNWETYNISSSLNLIILEGVGGIAALVAILFLIKIDPLITLAGILPLIIAGFLANWASVRIQSRRRTSRVAEGHVSAFIREVFHSVQAVQVAGAESCVVEHLQQLNQARRKATLEEKIFQDVIMTSLINNMSYISTGLVMLLVWKSMVAGEFLIADFALFTFFFPLLSDYAIHISYAVTTYQQTQVSLDRIAEVTGRQLDGLSNVLVQGEAVPGDVKGVKPAFVKNTDDLLKFEVKDLSYVYPTTKRGIHDISFQIPRGSFTVITGCVGSGKTTLLRSILGCLKETEGEVRWNGTVISDRDRFFIPPHSVYVSQLPKLFSHTIKENILLGNSSENIDRILSLSVLDQDIPYLEKGVNTVVGPQGFRLSGGQIQRVAIARAFAHAAQFYIFDDVSSALDLETEGVLWQRITSQMDATFLVVSHRQNVLKRADQIILLDEGRVIASGKLEDLLKSSSEMQKIWDGGRDLS
ncbi:MAG: ATP-binding cassette domain-containing protein [Bacteroidales bacterium]